MPRELLSVFEPLPAQRTFIKSTARIRGYGGAMGGGKSRTGCETIFDACLDHPGLVALVARQAHTSIVETTKKTMLSQVIPAELIEHRKASQGEDYIELFNGSRIHFIGLDDPLRWYSSEVGYLFFDEAQEIQEETVQRLITRLRQPGMPHRVIITFNPSSPGHWLQRWFILGGQPTEHGFFKPELRFDPNDPESESFGDVEFVKALAVDNVHLPESYIKFLKAQPAHLRRRYYEGLWEYTDGSCFFDLEALQHYESVAAGEKPVVVGSLVGDIADDIRWRIRKGSKPTDPVRVKAGGGPLTIFRKPVREHRYVIGVDASSGRGEDWTAMEVLDIDTFEQAAEFQAKLPPSEAAEWAYRLGRVYNDALVICEVTGGWGFAVDQKLREMRYPRPYTRRTYDRIAKKFTDKLGFDTTKRTRSMLLSTLEEAVRGKEIGIYSVKTVAELAAFVWTTRSETDEGKAQAQPGMHDDLVFALALAVFAAVEQPKQIRRPVDRPHIPQFTATGY